MLVSIFYIRVNSIILYMLPYYSIYDVPLLDLLLAIRICAENFSDEFESGEEELPHEIPATTDHGHNEDD